MNQLGDYLLTLLGEFAGGPGPAENNLVRFGLAAVMWFVLLMIAWSRQRTQHLPRERLLLLGFGLGLTRELFMLSQVSERIVRGDETGLGALHQPLEHAMTMAAIVAVAGAFLRYALDDHRVARRFLIAGGALTVVAFVVAAVVWPKQVALMPGLHFHDSWVAWLFHSALLALMGVAIYYLSKDPNWLTRVVTLALSLFFLSELIILINYGTDKSYNNVMCPVANSLHLLAIPVLGFVYLREQNVEKRQAEDALAEYREHLEELVAARTAELENVNAQMRDEIREREETERALEDLTHRYEMILASTGEGICGLDRKGRFMFVNPAAAAMLGYDAADLIGRPSHAVWLHSYADGTPYAEVESPITPAYRHGVKRYGDDEVFWRRSGANFPVRYFANPVRAQDELAGAVVVFQDITERRQAEIEIARRNARLAAQNAVASTVSQSLDLNRILNDALDTVLSMQDLALGAIFLQDADGESTSEAPKLQAVRGCVSAERLIGDASAQAFLIELATDAILQEKTISRALADVEPALNGTPAIAQCLTQQRIRTVISIPLIAKGRTVGSLTVGSRDVDADQLPLLDQLTAIGQQIAMAVENARLYQAAERSSAELDLLHRVSGPLAATLDPDAVSQAVAEQSLRLSGCDMAAVIRCTTDASSCEVVAAQGLQPDERMLLHSAYPRRLLEELSGDQQTIISADALADPLIPHVWRRQLGIRTTLCLPVWRDATMVEVLVLMDRTARRWRDDDVRLIERFGRRASVAQTNARFHQQTEVSAALEERQRIAANMHDGLAQVLSYMNLKTDVALVLLENHEVERALEELLLVQSAIDRASVDVRRSITSLQSDPEPQRSLQDALERIANEFEVDDEPPVSIACELSDEVYLMPEESEQVLRVVQEAILNARRHAKATAIDVSVQELPSALRVVVEDNGEGFDRGFDSGAPIDNRGHFGLSIMQARAAHINGELEIDTRPGEGTRVILTWPSHAIPPNVVQPAGQSQVGDPWDGDCTLAAAWEEPLATTR